MVEKFVGTSWSVKVVIYRHDSSRVIFGEKDIDLLFVFKFELVSFQHLQHCVNS